MDALELSGDDGSGAGQRRCVIPFQKITMSGRAKTSRPTA